MTRPRLLQGGPRRSGPALATALLLLLVTHPAAAQPEADVRLFLRSQSSMVTAERGLRVRVDAANRGATRHDDLALALWIYHPVRSRTAYVSGLAGEPPTTVLTVRSHPVAGPLDGTETRRLGAIDQPVPELAARGETALYPLKVELQSAGVTIASLRSAVVFIAEEPLVPLNVSMTFLLTERVRFRPDGTYVDDALERAVGPGGRLAGLLRVLEEDIGSLTLAISPLLPLQLEDMADGYAILDGGGVRQVEPGDPEAERAALALDRLRALARSPATEVVALPYAAPLVPTLVAGGLGRDLRVQVERGREAIRGRLAVTPAPALFRPPGSALSEQSLGPLHRLGVRAVILDHDTLEPSTGLVLSPPATTTVPFGRRRSMRAVAPDVGVADRLESLPDDPRLRALHVLGELTALYLERPSDDRGVAMVLERDDVEPLFLRALLRGMRGVPRGTAWLEPVPVARLLLVGEDPDAEPRAIVPGRVDVYSQAFLNDLRVARQSITQLRSMTGRASDLPRELRARLLVAEAREFVHDERGGLEFIRSVTTAVEGEFEKVLPPGGESAVTLTSRSGPVPLTFTNLATYPANVRIILSSPRLDFPEGDVVEDVVLPPEGRTRIDVLVRAEATGRFPLQVVVETPRGGRIAESVIPVRSTAYSRVALLVTVGAALFLALWSGRRALRPRR
ncbi:MAG: hypothetical protein M3245_00530 [Actinomycetota bacterium]|nr:hypothetical protein [Actinomycetota bacterium]